WPELVEAIENAGLKNYSLFRRDNQVTAYVECHPDITTAFGKIGATDVNERWSKWFEDVILSLVDDNGDLYWADEVWHLD
ncbi:MAG: L-rhamnose mutarotase, partial [Acidimicrobiales bacterium]|nr:L-rhamnose mutarotase [Acidimicrobiales bacterium]